MVSLFGIAILVVCSNLGQFPFQPYGHGGPYIVGGCFELFTQGSKKSSQSSTGSKYGRKRRARWRRSRTWAHGRFRPWFCHQGIYHQTYWVSCRDEGARSVSNQTLAKSARLTPDRRRVRDHRFGDHWGAGSSGRHQYRSGCAQSGGRTRPTRR